MGVDTSIDTDVIVYTSAAGVDLVNLTKALAQEISDASKPVTSTVFNVNVVLKPPTSPESVGVFHDQSGATVPVVFVDVIYHDSPMIALSVPVMKNLLYKTVPEVVQDTVSTYLTPKVDVNNIRFTQALSIMEFDPPNKPGAMFGPGSGGRFRPSPGTEFGPGPGEAFGSDLEERLRKLRQQLREIDQLLSSKL